MSKRTRSTERKTAKKKAKKRALQTRRAKGVHRKALKAAKKRELVVVTEVVEEGAGAAPPFATHGSGGGRND